MRNKKFNLTGYQAFISSQNPANSHQVSNRYRSTFEPYKSAFLKRDLGKKMREVEIENILINKQSVFSLQKLSFQKKKEQKQLFQGARLPNFNVKKFLQRSVNKKYNEPTYDMSRSQSLSQRRQITVQPALKRYWERYLNEQITHADLTKELNKNVVDVSQREKKNQSQVQKIERKNQQFENKIEKSAFYINNFIKTTYRKRRFDQKIKIQVQEPIKQAKNTQQKSKTPKKIANFNSGDQKSWSMIPWQKFNEVQEEELFIPL